MLGDASSSFEQVVVLTKIRVVLPNSTVTTELAIKLALDYMADGRCTSKRDRRKPHAGTHKSVGGGQDQLQGTLRYCGKRFCGAIIFLRGTGIGLRGFSGVSRTRT